MPTGEIYETGTINVYMTMCDDIVPDCAGTYKSVVEPVSTKIEQLKHGKSTQK